MAILDDGADPGAPSSFESIYDAETIAAVDAWSPPRGTGAGPDRVRGEPSRVAAAPGRPGWRGLTAGVALNAMVLGTVDALDEGPVHEAVVELRSAADPNTLRAVTFWMVPDAPRASRVIVRPWLAG